MNDIRPTADTKGAGKILGPEGKPWSRNTIKRKGESDPTFPKPLHDGYRLQWFIDELVTWKESQPRRQYVFDSSRRPASLRGRATAASA